MELIDYVTNTPQNTNKTILKQLVNDEKSKAVYESVEELKENRQIGYTELGEELTLRESELTDESVLFPGGFVKVADEVVDLTKVTHVDLIGNGDGELFTCTVINLTVGVLSEELASAVEHSCLFGFIEEFNESVPIAISVAKSPVDTFPVGTYLVIANECRLEFAETIHTIDPKYLPGVCLPQITLSEETLTKLQTIGTAKANAKETEFFKIYYDAMLPVIVNGSLGGNKFGTVMPLIANLTTGYHVYKAQVTVDGTWLQVAIVTEDGVTGVIISTQI